MKEPLAPKSGSVESETAEEADQKQGQSATTTSLLLDAKRRARKKLD